MQILKHEAASKIPGFQLCLCTTTSRFCGAPVSNSPPQPPPTEAAVLEVGRCHRLPDIKEGCTSGIGQLTSSVNSLRDSRWGFSDSLYLPSLLQNLESQKLGLKLKSGIVPARTIS